MEKIALYGKMLEKSTKENLLKSEIKKYSSGFKKKRIVKLNEFEFPELIFFFIN